MLLATFLLVVFRDLTEGILVGFALGTLLFLYRIAQAVEVRGDRSMIQEGQADGDYARFDAAFAPDSNVILYGISGAIIFGATAGVASALMALGKMQKLTMLLFRMSH